jgi:fatty acid kinase
MGALTSLEVADIERALRVFSDALSAHRAALNALNVYPVPDGDTGTNMSLTLRSVVEEIDRSGSEPAERWKAISHGSLMGARGNSGVIMSQILRGLCVCCSEVPAIDAEVLARALTDASEAAYGAVLRPVEGTILTVVRESASASSMAAAAGNDLAVTVTAAVEEAMASLERTPDLLPVLKDAGVVDAGAAGYLLFLQALRSVVDGTPVPEAPVVAEEAAPPTPAVAPSDGVADLRYEVMFFLDADDDRIDEFKSAWAALGDSIVVVGGDGLWNCHIHSNQIGASIEAGIAVGRPHRIRVSDLFEEIEHLEDLKTSEDSSVIITSAETATTTAVVAVAAGQGVQRIFESLGVHAVIRGGQSMNPSTRQLVQAAQQVAADQVVVLPNNKNIIPVAEQVDSQLDKRVVVVPTRSIAEGFASLLAFDPGADAENNRLAMAAAAEAVVAGEVTQAVRESDTAAGHVTEGDWIGLDGSGVRSIASSAAVAATELLEQLVTDDHELVTVIAGAGASEATVESVRQWLEEKRPDTEVEVHDGGQPLYPFYFGIE